MAERILIVDEATRAHALAWKISRDRPGCELFVAPGNAGIAPLASLVPIPVTDIRGIVDWCRRARPDLVIIGPCRPHRLGIVDVLSSDGIRAFGPTALGATIESSKAWAAELAVAAGVPMPGTHAFRSADAADAFVARQGRPFVVKPDGEALAASVSVNDSVEETHAAIDRVARQLLYGRAGARLVLQERVRGHELQVTSFTDGVTPRVIGAARSYKHAKDGDEGPFTSGMGSYAPVAEMTADLQAEIEARILAPLLAGLRRRGIRYIGFIEVGVMQTVYGPLALEFNCRLGDPTADVILPLLRVDLIEAVEAAFAGDAASFEIPEPSGAAVCVMMRRGGASGAPSASAVIDGLGPADDRVVVFHSKTAREDGRWLFEPGAVLGVTGLGATVTEARRRAYAAVRAITYEGAEWRTQIGAEAAWVGVPVAKPRAKVRVVHPARSRSARSDRAAEDLPRP
jgi:phosphoribosylamine--glycine ligase